MSSGPRTDSKDKNAKLSADPKSFDRLVVAYKALGESVQTLTKTATTWKRYS